MDDTVAKQRIISHMNADHQDSISRYLQHHHSQTVWSSSTGRITSISLSELTMSCSTGTFTTPFTPPMSSLREARERLVAMDKACVTALGVSDITIRTFPPPTGPFLAGCVIVVSTLVSFSSRGNFAPEGVIGSVVPEFFRRFCYAIQPILFTTVLGIHVVETVWMAFGRLRKYNVSPRSKVYWFWLGDAFCEGVGSYIRFDRLVKTKKMEKEKVKH
ncbi:hypothetical protein ANO11243_043220 [Dothideomycetidae sp. 11243]|nr:hypothetical protein ANO11243_043220 [fungal sp. No.11243]